MRFVLYSYVQKLLEDLPTADQTTISQSRCSLKNEQCFHGYLEKIYIRRTKSVLNAPPIVEYIVFNSISDMLHQLNSAPLAINSSAIRVCPF